MRGSSLIAAWLITLITHHCISTRCHNNTNPAPLSRSPPLTHNLTDWIVASSQGGRTSLITASENGYLEVVKALVALGADVKAKDNVSDTTETTTWGEGLVVRC